MLIHCLKMAAVFIITATTLSAAADNHAQSPLHVMKKPPQTPRLRKQYDGSDSPKRNPYSKMRLAVPVEENIRFGEDAPFYGHQITFHVFDKENNKSDQLKLTFDDFMEIEAKSDGFKTLQSCIEIKIGVASSHFVISYNGTAPMTMTTGNWFVLCRVAFRNEVNKTPVEIRVQTQ